MIEKSVLLVIRPASYNLSAISEVESPLLMTTVTAPSVSALMSYLPALISSFKLLNLLSCEMT